MLQIEAFPVSPFVLGFLYVFTEIRVKRAPLRLWDVRSRILPRRRNCDYGRIADVALALALRSARTQSHSTMPKPDGWEVLSALKADADLCEIPVVIVSVAPDRGIGMSLGAVDVLTKSCRPGTACRPDRCGATVRFSSSRMIRTPGK